MTPKSLITALLALCMLSAPVYSQQFYTLPHDKIPHFAERPTITAVKSGNWSAPSTWQPARLPQSDDILSFGAATVTFDVDYAQVDTLHVDKGAQLLFPHDKSSHLSYSTIQIVNGGAVKTTSYLQVPHQIRLSRRDLPLQTTPQVGKVYDPSQYGGGILVINGTFMLESAVKTPFLPVAGEVDASAATLSVRSAPQHWLPGDILLLSDSRQHNDITVKQSPWHIELPLLRSVSANSVTLQTPLVYSHPGARNSLTNSLDFTPHIANLTRQILLDSEVPTGTRGHILVTGASYGHFDGVHIKDMGRTTVATLDSTTYDKSGNVITIGKNEKGKYAVHFHHLYGPRPSASQPPLAYQFVFKNNVVTSTIDPNKWKWHVTIHDSHFGAIEDNVLYNCGGACIMTEEGNEYRNSIKRNMIVYATGQPDRMGLGAEATGIWLRGMFNDVSDNVVANIVSRSRGGPQCGYSLWQHQLSATLKIPKFRGASTAIAGEYDTINPFATPLYRFENNEVYSSSCGMTYWWIGAHYLTPKAQEPNVVKDFKAWNMYTTALYNYQSDKLVFDGLTTRGSAENMGCCHEALRGGDYFSSDMTIRNSSLHGFLDGLVWSTVTNGVLRLENTEVVTKRYGSVHKTMFTAHPSSEAIGPRHIVLDHSFFKPIPSSTVWRSIAMLYDGTSNAVRTFVQHDSVEVIAYQGVEGTDFHVYYPQQIPTFVVPETTKNPNGTIRIYGAPEPGLSNAAALQEYNVAIAGAVAPCADTTKHLEIAGIVCYPTLPPQPTAGQVLYDRCGLTEPWSALTSEKQQQWQLCASP